MVRTPSIGIARRDFLNGLLIAAGGSAIVGSVPTRALAALAGASCDGPIGLDPRALRGGNLPSTFMVSHWLRDERLRFETGSVTVAPGCDEIAGTFPIIDESAGFDAIVIGGGLSGLSAAFHLLRERPRARVAILEAASRLGGNAGRDEGAPLPGPASTAGAYGAAPAADWLAQFYRALRVDWRAQSIPGPESSFYFDEFAPGAIAGRRWNIDTFEKGLAQLPYDARIVADFARAREAIRALGEKGLTDPADESDPALDDLSTIGLRHYLDEQLRCDPIVAQFFTAYTLTAFGGTAEQVNAHSALAFLSSEFTRGALFTYPGGTSEIARRAQRFLTQSETPPRIECDATALRIDPRSSNARAGASVVYFKDGGFRRVSARQIILAAPAQSARHLVAHVSDAARKEAWSGFHAAPIVTANVTLRRAAPLLELGLGYSQSWWGGRHFVNYIVADWMSDKRADPERQTTLTFYGGCDAPLDGLAEARMKLMHTPFSDYEDSLRNDLSRLMRGADFDFDRDVRALFLYRWGHSMLRPPPGFLFGATRDASGRLDRAQAPRRIACAPLGPVVFAGQHVEGAPSVESAVGSGRRAALQALKDQ
ncbi:FAD-dependent oxidoreductase [Methylosinus sp. H3A]|uniref:FAD-dependent oxidoreductase n=1 Tax=Methylosinus sp. H3A TaxID=2785786 RepID=UPI0018C2FD49|nr:FAD-dependent oxidoreductase [Methylosinus sp. H3A]MBG0810643.1 FAD-dependent oxidoreductase [Methylosinus sp. H3A]